MYNLVWFPHYSNLNNFLHATQEFGERLLRVNVTDPEEHLALFKSLFLGWN